MAARASGVFRPPGHPDEGGDPDQQNAMSPAVNLANFVTKGPQPSGTIAAEVQNGSIRDAKVGNKSKDANGVPQMNAKSLSDAQLKALSSVPQDGNIHTITVPDLGQFRAIYASGPNGTYYVAVPTTDADSTVTTLILVEISVSAAGLIAASLAGATIVGVALRPLRKVAATATRASELPLHTGEVNLNVRVPESECDPHTEVGRVGAALNRMLDHVHDALHARQQSETRIRQFVADASHELRTPLTSIRGYAELVNRGIEQLGPDTSHALIRIGSEADRMTLLVEDLLLLARLDAGRPLEFGQVDLYPLVIDTVSDARVAGPSHNWRLELPDESTFVSADGARLQQVLVNLLGNARSHTLPGTTVTARVRRSGTWVCVDVEDNGQGIPPDVLPYIFERFARGDSARSRASGSTGLGLAIVKAVVTAHGGTVTVDSVPGRTVFTVHLPIPIRSVSGQPVIETVGNRTPEDVPTMTPFRAVVEPR